MTTLLEMILAIEIALRNAHVPHAFGGALALGYHVAEPRATRDIDINCFVPTEDAHSTFEVLPREIRWGDGDVETVRRVGQVRLFWEQTPIDLFFTNHPFHERAAAHTEEVPLADTHIPILGATDLAVFKAFFDRTRDWADIEAMVDERTVDLHIVIGWIVDLLGADDDRVSRLRALLDREPPDEEPRFAPP
jgi:hypothetical protein